MAITQCQRNATNGVVDMAYLEHRLDSIEARIDDLCGLLGEVLEWMGVPVSVVEEIPTERQGLELDES